MEGDVTGEVVESTQGSEEEGGSKAASESTGEEAYTPTLTYKVLDEERKFDDRLASVVKDKESEEYFRNLYTKADGLDAYKQKYSELEGQSKQLVAGYQQLKQLRDQGNVSDLMKAIGLKDEAIFDYVQARLKEEQLPEEDRKIVERERRLQKENEVYKQKLSDYEQRVVETNVESDIRELEMLAATPTVSPVAAAMEKNGLNFADEVIKDGHFEYLRTGKEPPIKSVVERIAKRYSYLATNKAAPTKQPTLPTVKGGNASAIDKPITSLDELRKFAAAQGL
jgi:hypothetical protein